MEQQLQHRHERRSDCRRRTVILLTATALAAACAQPRIAPLARPDDDRARTHYTIVWSDPAGLDLTSAEGTYVRGSIESLDVSAVNGNTDAAAPGFWHTLTGTAVAAAQDFFEMGPAQPEYGIKRYEILDTASDGDSTTVTVCTYNHQVGHKNAEHEYEFGGTGPFTTLITYEPVGAQAPAAGQSGPETFPQTNVFGTWQTVNWQTGYFAGEDPCAGRPTPGVAPGSWPQTRGAGPYIAQEPPREPSYPGWPRGVA